MSAAELYEFEYHGARFSLNADPSIATTTEGPNVRVLQGSWMTWRLIIDPNTPGIEGLRLLSCVSDTGGEHPLGNLTPEQSATNGHQLMISSDGYLYGIPTGYGAVGRLYTSQEWQDQLAAWERWLPHRMTA